MGCDIHSLAQVKKDGSWKTIKIRIAQEPRSYNTFALLADVRNGVGFAGRETGEAWPVLYPCRGLPDDIEKDEDDESNVKLDFTWYWSFDPDKKDPQTTLWMGDHSHSWLSLSEIKNIKDFLKDKFYTARGMITLQQREDLERGILPTNWCSFTNMDGYVNSSWKRPANECHCLDLYIKELEEVGSQVGAADEEVRLVFGFDS